MCVIKTVLSLSLRRVYSRLMPVFVSFLSRLADVEDFSPAREKGSQVSLVPICPSLYQGTLAKSKKYVANIGFSIEVESLMALCRGFQGGRRG